MNKGTKQILGSLLLFIGGGLLVWSGLNSNPMDVIYVVFGGAILAFAVVFVIFSGKDKKDE